MDYYDACKESSQCKELEGGKGSEEDIEFDEAELEEGEIREPARSKSHIHRDIGINDIELSSFRHAIMKDSVSKTQSASHIRDTQGFANTIDMQKLEHRASGSQTVEVRQREMHGEYSRSYSYVKSSSNKRHKQEYGYYGYSEYQQALKKIEEVSSRRFKKLLAWHNEDRKEFNVLCKKQEFEYLQEHVRSYKVHYMRAVSTIRYCRMKLPKLRFTVLRKKFHKHYQSQLIEFVKRQIKDRDKEKRIRKRWILEAEAGYLMKGFYMIPLPYSGLTVEKLKCPLTDYSNVDEPLNYFNMEGLSTEIEAIASSIGPKGTHAGKTSNGSETTVKNSQLLLESNGSTQDGISVGPSEEVFTCERRSPQSTCEATRMVFGQNNGTQIACPVVAQSNGGHTKLSYASQSDSSTSLAKANAVAVDTRLLSIAKGRRSSSDYDVSQRKFLSESTSRLCKTPLLHKEAPSGNHEISLDTISLQEAPCANQQISSDTISLQEAPSSSPPSTNAIQMEQPKDKSSEIALSDQTSSFAQVTKQPDMNANTSIINATPEMNANTSIINATPEMNANISMINATQQQHFNSTLQAVTQPPDGSSPSVRTGFVSSRASNIEAESHNQILTNSIEQCPSEVGFDPIAVELSRLQHLRVLLAKRHQEKRQQHILAREIEMAEAKRKYDEQIYKLEMESLQRKKELELLSQKVHKQQVLAEEFQSMFVTHRSRGAAKRKMTEPNGSSGQQAFELPASVSAPASGVMCQPSQQGAQPFMGSSPRCPFVTTNHSTVDSLGRSATPLAHNRSAGMDTAIVYHAPEPHPHAVVNPLPPSGLHFGVASLEH
uniref:Uncharacterized protein n=1 Tax=Leersia perrieri TaxID=77586 RepID=A0A0D9VIJ5_9ORYZ